MQAPGLLDADANIHSHSDIGDWVSFDDFMRKRIVLFGLFGGPNIGNNATCEAVVAAIRLRRPEFEIRIVAPTGSDVLERFGTPHLPIDPLPISRFLWRIKTRGVSQIAWNLLRVLTEPARFARAKRALLGADALLVVGTGVIDEFGQTPLSLPLDLYRWVGAAKHVGAQVHFVSVGAESVASKLARQLFSRALRQADSITVRDAFSARQLSNLSVRCSPDCVFPDLAFGLSVPATLPHFKLSASSGPVHVVVGLMGYFGWNQPPHIGEQIYAAYLSKMKEIIGHLLDAGNRVTLVVGDTQADRRPGDDLMVALESHAGFNRLTNAATGSTDGVLQIISSADIVIASRFHNALFGVLAERKVISLSYSIKNDELLGAMGGYARCFPIESFSVSAVLESLKELLDIDYELVRAHARVRLDAWRRLLEHQYDKLLSKERLDATEESG